MVGEGLTGEGGGGRWIRQCGRVGQEKVRERCNLLQYVYGQTKKEEMRDSI